MITTLMNQKRVLNRLSKLPDDGDPWAPNNLLKPGTKVKHQLNPGGPSNRQEAPAMNSFYSRRQAYNPCRQCQNYSDYFVVVWLLW